MALADAVISEFATCIGRDYVVTGAGVDVYCQDWRGRYRGAALTVLKPATTAEVAEVVRICHHHGLAIVPQGGMTSLCGAATPLAEGPPCVIINLGRLRKIRELDRDNRTITVESGLTLAELQQAAGEAGLLFPLSLASEGSCQVGGILSTNAGGVQVLRYGNTRDLVLGLEVVLPDGEVWKGLRALRKDNTGYDLKQLFIGAEGTLGLITAAVFKLFPAPRHTETLWGGVASVDQAIELLRRFQSDMGETITAFELVSDVALDLVLRHIPGARLPLPQRSPWYVLAEFSTTLRGAWLRDGLMETLSAMEGAFDNMVLAETDTQRQTLWHLRESISEAQKREGFSIKHDISLPLSTLPDFLDVTRQALQQRFPGVRFVCFGHLGDGNLHYNLSFDAAADNQRLMACEPEIHDLVHRRVHERGGSISAEHGIGQLKRQSLAELKSPLEIDLMRRIKHTLDPLGRLNPGKVLP